MSRTDTRSALDRVAVAAGAPTVLIDLARYALVSLVALACDYGLLIMLTGFGMFYLAAATISFLVGMGVAYALSTRFVFADRRDPSALRESAGFVVVGLAGLVLTQALLAVFVSSLAMNVAVAKVPTTACVFAFNFLARRSLVFGGRRPAPTC